MTLRLRKDSELRVVCDDLATKHDLPAVVVKDLLYDALAVILAKTMESGRFQLRGVGVFHRRHLAAKPARNPRTGERVMVPERVQIGFTQEGARVRNGSRETGSETRESAEQAE